tara:strand:+ start:13492 stop:14091 length:600 start_codon:yes stop_codon:yes gene_type:complete
MSTSKIICSKDNIVLKKYNNNLCNNSDNFTIDLQIHNKLNLKMNNIINYKLLNLIGCINSDIIEKSEIVNNISESEIDVIYIFKRFGADFGISKKYCFLKTNIEYINENDIIIHSKSIQYLKPIDAKPIIFNDNNLYIKNINEQLINIHYDFKAYIDEEMPMYMENILGILMKKVLTNFKMFIENININNLDINNINNA